MVHRVFLSKDRVLIRVGLFWNFLAQSGSCCPSKGKNMSQIELSWGNGKSGFWIMCPWMSIGNEKVILCNHGQVSERDFGYDKS